MEYDHAQGLGGENNEHSIAEIYGSIAILERKAELVQQALFRRANPALKRAAGEFSDSFLHLAMNTLPVDTDAAIELQDRLRASRRSGRDDHSNAMTAIEKDVVSYFETRMREHFAEVAARGSRSPAVRERLMMIDHGVPSARLISEDISHLFEASPSVAMASAKDYEALVRVDLDLRGVGFVLPPDKSSVTFGVTDDLERHSALYFQDDPDLEALELDEERTLVARYADMMGCAQTALDQAVSAMPDTDFVTAGSHADNDSNDLINPYSRIDEVQRKREQLVASGLRSIDETIGEIAKAVKYDDQLKEGLIASDISNWNIQLERVEGESSLYGETRYRLTSAGFDAWSNEFEQLVVSVNEY